MTPLIICLVLCIAAMTWTNYSKIHSQLQLPRVQRRYGDTIILTLPAIATLVNAVLVYRLIQEGTLSPILHLIQMFACCSIVPLVYMYFSRQVGRELNNATTILLWALCLLIFIPNLYIYPYYSPYVAPEFTPKLFAIYYIVDGQKTWGIYTGDLIVIIQALITMVRVIPLTHTLRNAGLQFTPQVYAFFVWWILTAVYIIIISALNLTELRTPFGLWSYFMGLTICMITICALFAMNFDLYMVQTKTGEVVQDVSAYIEEQQSKKLAQQMEQILTNEQLYRHQGYTAEDMCERLGGVNRRQFTSMMRSEFGKTFALYLTEKRLLHAQNLLMTTTMKMDQVAEESGFASRSHMSHFFKQHFDRTPSEWIKDQKED